MSELGIKNPMQVPKLEKITVNMGIGEAIANPKLLDTAVEELSRITGQRPVVQFDRAGELAVTGTRDHLGDAELQENVVGCVVNNVGVREEFGLLLLDRLRSIGHAAVRRFPVVRDVLGRNEAPADIAVPVAVTEIALEVGGGDILLDGEFHAVFRTVVACDAVIDDLENASLGQAEILHGVAAAAHVRPEAIGRVLR